MSRSPSFKNTTYLILFSVAYLVFFGFFIGIMGRGYITFNTSDAIFLLAGTSILALGAAIVTAGIAGITLLGSGSAEAGRYVWLGAVLTEVTFIAFFFVNKLRGLMPADTPATITYLFLAPPLAALSWGIFSIVLKYQEMS